MPPRRRDFLFLAGMAGFAYTAPRAIRSFTSPLAFEAVPGLPGFRLVQSGPVSAGNPALIGLERASQNDIARRASVRANPCLAVFGPDPGDGQVPLAVFSDYYCPNCPALSQTVIDLVSEGVPARVTWHELPILGPRSVSAARAAIAAGNQGRYLEMHERMMTGGLRPGPAALRALAQELKLDPDRFLSDIIAPETEARLRASKAAAEVFGLYGTPSFVLGRTVSVGAQTKQSMRELFEFELKSPPNPPLCG